MINDGALDALTTFQKTGFDQRIEASSSNENLQYAAFTKSSSSQHPVPVKVCMLRCPQRCNTYLLTPVAEPAASSTAPLWRRERFQTEWWERWCDDSICVISSPCVIPATNVWRKLCTSSSSMFCYSSIWYVFETRKLLHCRTSVPSALHRKGE